MPAGAGCPRDSRRDAGATMGLTGVAMRMLSGWRMLLVAVLLCFPIPSSAEVLKIVVNDTIHPITDEYIGRALAEAERNKDQALLIELNTPGGLVDSTRDIIEKILASPVPVIVYVTPSGSRAASAGFFILESADVAVMAPGTNTGAAHPVTLGGGKVDDVMKEKMENDAAALMRSVVSKRGRNVEVAESTVRQSKSFTDQEALSQKLIDYVATSDQNLLQQMQGKTIKRFDGKTVTLNLEGEQIRRFDMTLKQRILAFIMVVTFILRSATYEPSEFSVISCCYFNRNRYLIRPRNGKYLRCKHAHRRGRRRRSIDRTGGEDVLRRARANPGVQFL